jgi:hypothetical protein
VATAASSPPRGWRHQPRRVRVIAGWTRALDLHAGECLAIEIE